MSNIQIQQFMETAKLIMPKLSVDNQQLFTLQIMTLSDQKYVKLLSEISYVLNLEVYELKTFFSTEIAHKQLFNSYYLQQLVKDAVIKLYQSNANNQDTTKMQIIIQKLIVKYGKLSLTSQLSDITGLNITQIIYYINFLKQDKQMLMK
ncbi:Hypothetical_protein [Hexamita inflata]|uniref:Hypothetical_protein n=1 Tax=Hexamita inflata TaxID=28002 RepID=A0AA86TWI3_9EUKA|nr:Hypothetical protein HINF_LOCUS19452 [Hexamita inflata]CAI9931810.1 Hypothetical protein HINF_LOCUS19455 [Hexamita inflata]